MADSPAVDAKQNAELPRGFHWLEVAEICAETSEATSVTFDIPAELTDNYSYIQGQYLTLMREFEGERLRRPYSLWLAPQEGKLRICSKKLAGGRMSGFINEQLQVGDTLAVMEPMGRFYQAEANKNSQDENSQRYVMIAGGSGITPVMSNIRSILQNQPDAIVTLFYGNRTVESIIFREQLADMKNRFMGRFEVLHILSQEQSDLEIFNGQLDQQKLETLLNSFLDVSKVDHYFICGPGPMMEGAKDTLQSLDVEDDRITIESFGEQIAPQSDGTSTHQKMDGDIAAVATVILGGIKTEVKIREGEKVLDAALAAKLDLPYACRGGVCCTCKALLVEGEVTMDVNYGLEEEEVERGFVLTCQSRPVSDKIVLDYDAI